MKKKIAIIDAGSKSIASAVATAESKGFEVVQISESEASDKCSLPEAVFNKLPLVSLTPKKAPETRRERRARERKQNKNKH